MIADYVSGQDVTRVSVSEVRFYSHNPKRNDRVRRKLIKRAMQRSTYGKVPFSFWESVVADGTEVEPNYYVVDVAGEIRLYCSRLESKAAFLRRFVDLISHT